MISVAFGGSIILLPEYEITIYVSFMGFTFDSTSSPSSYEKRRPKRAFEILLVMVFMLLLTASCSPPTGVVVAVVLLPAVDADIRGVVDAKIIVSVKIVATRWMLRSRGIFLLRLFSIPILSTFQERNKG